MFRGNGATRNMGGAMIVYGVTPVLVENSKFYTNYAASPAAGGGAVYVVNSVKTSIPEKYVLFNACVFWHNYAPVNS